MTLAPGGPTGGSFADIRIGRHPASRWRNRRCPLSDGYHRPGGARSGPADTARKQPAPPANGGFDRARDSTKTPYSANSHRRSPSCSFHDLCQTACPVASPDEAGLALHAPPPPRDISAAGTSP